MHPAPCTYTYHRFIDSVNHEIVNIKTLISQEQDKTLFYETKKILICASEGKF